MSSFTQDLKPYQRNLLASAAVLIASVIIVGFLFGVFLLLKLFTSNFSSVLWPLATAGIISMILRPVVGWSEHKLKLSRIQSIGGIYILMLIIVTLILSILLPILVEQTVNFIHRLPVIWTNLKDAVMVKFPAFEEMLIDLIGEDRLESTKLAIASRVESSMELLPSAAQDIFSKFKQVLSFGTGLAIVPVYLFFFLKSDRDLSIDLEHQLSFLKKEWRSDLVFLIREFVGSIEAFFRGQILIGFIIGVLLATAFTSIGVNFGIGLGLLIGALNIIPYLGTIIGLGTVLPIAYFQPDGGLLLMALALASFILVQMLEGYVLTPRIMGEKTGLHPLTIIIAIFFWGVALDGLLGMVLAIPLTAFFVVAWRLAKLKYLRYFSGVESEESSEGNQEKAEADAS
jgi:predicted PurR-regulated permease PerM